MIEDFEFKLGIVKPNPSILPSVRPKQRKIIWKADNMPPVGCRNDSQRFKNFADNLSAAMLHNITFFGELLIWFSQSTNMIV
jgi:hypothetical protein